MSKLRKEFLSGVSVENYLYSGRMKKYFLLSIVLFLLFGCFVFSAAAATVNLTWNSNQEPDLAGYKVYYGTSSREYPHVLDVGNANSCQLEVPDDSPCYIALTAYDVADNESGYSEEIVVFAELAGVVQVDLDFAGEDEALAAEDATNDVYPRMTGDVNGDGNDDLLIFGHRGVYVCLSTGSGYDDPVVWYEGFTKGAGGWTSQDVYPRMLADVNGDGMADIVGFGYKGVYVALSSGGGFDWNGDIWIESFAKGAGGWYSQDVYPRMLADVNGDGMADIVGSKSLTAYHLLMK